MSKGKLLYPCDDEFFSKEEEKSFYWAGFIAADGCVRITSKNSRSLALVIAEKDLRHLEEFKKNICAESPIFHRKYGKYNVVCLSITSTIIFNDLSKFNVCPAKTLKYSFPEWLKNHPLKHHFMRGYIDGDGCFRIRERGKCKNKHLYLSLRGTKDFLDTFRYLINSECKLDNKISITFDCKVGRIEYGGNLTVNKIVDFLYKDATIFLKRKHEKAYLLRNYYE